MNMTLTIQVQNIYIIYKGKNIYIVNNLTFADTSIHIFTQHKSYKYNAVVKTPVKVFTKEDQADQEIPLDQGS